MLREEKRSKLNRMSTKPSLGIQKSRLGQFVSTLTKYLCLGWLAGLCREYTCLESIYLFVRIEESSLENECHSRWSNPLDTELKNKKAP